jgi:hypothetical protein
VIRKIDSSHNIFLDDGDDDLPQDHIRNRKLATVVTTPLQRKTL